MFADSAHRPVPLPVATSVTWDRLTALGPRVVDAGLLLGVGLLVLLDLFTAQNTGGGRVLVKVGISATALVAVAARRRFPLGSMLAMVAAILFTSWGRDLFAAGPYSNQYPTFARWPRSARWPRPSSAANPWSPRWPQGSLAPSPSPACSCGPSAASS